MIIKRLYNKWKMKFYRNLIFQLIPIFFAYLKNNLDQDNIYDVKKIFSK